MISHALTIVVNELNNHLVEVYKMGPGSNVGLGNMAEGFGNSLGTSGIPRDMLILSLVNIKEEKALKNLPNYVRDDVAIKAIYQNPPIFLNCYILVVATHTNYTNALTMLSRAIRFFQFKNVFTQDNVAPASMNSTIDPRDQLETFKLSFEIFSPTMEDVNYLWSTLGGKQYPFALYVLRLIELQFKAIQSESSLITEVAKDFYVKPPVGN